MVLVFINYNNPDENDLFSNYFALINKYIVSKYFVKPWLWS